MTAAISISLPSALATELESRYFWWEPVGGTPRTPLRILAQAMKYASFSEVRRLETTLGASQLTDALLASEPGWFDDRSWEFWRGRLACATGLTLPAEPPRRFLDDASV